MIICSATGMPCGCVADLCNREVRAQWLKKQAERGAVKAEILAEVAYMALNKRKGRYVPKPWDELPVEYRAAYREMVDAVLKAMRDKSLLP